MGSDHCIAIAVTEGIKPGEQVVTTANFLIDSESRLKAAVQGSARGKE